jgi:hypothetical protein
MDLLLYANPKINISYISILNKIMIIYFDRAKYADFNFGEAY